MMHSIKNILFPALVLMALTGCVAKAPLPELARTAEPPPPALQQAATAQPDAAEPADYDAGAFDLRAAADADMQTALYRYFRGTLHESDWFDQRVAKGAKICVYALRPYRAGTLAVADFHLDGELAPDLFYLEDGEVRCATTGSDCWSINYTRFCGDTIVYGKSFAWDGGPLRTTHATAVFADGQTETLDLPGEAGPAQPGFLFVAAGETWLHTLTLYDGDSAVADQDSGEFSVGQLAERFHPALPVCRWLRFQPMLDGDARARRLDDAAQPTPQAVVGGTEQLLHRWYPDTGLAFPDLWRTVNNGTPVPVKSNLPVELTGLAREDAVQAWWVELALDDGTPAGEGAAVRSASIDEALDSGRSGTPAEKPELLRSTPGAPGHYGSYVLILDYGDCYYTAAFMVERG